MLTAPLLSLLTALLQVSATQAPSSRQPTVEADSGSRVRITVGKTSKHVGTLVSADADSLRFTTDTSGVVAIPTSSVTRFERSRGRRSNAGKGALIAGVIGGALGLIGGIGAEADNSDWGIEIGAEGIALATLFLGATGAGLGALIGAASKGEKWKPLTIPK